MQDRDWEKGISDFTARSLRFETRGGGKGYFSGIFGLPFSKLIVT